MKKNIAIFFGSKSCEHDISIITALQTIKNIDLNKYNVFPVYITQDLIFLTGKCLLDINSYKDKTKLKHKCKKMVFSFEKKRTLIKKFCFCKKINIDCAILALHGLFGEDGTIQSLLEMFQIPYTSAGYKQSGLCMDKIFMKDILKANCIPICDYVAIRGNVKSFNVDEIPLEFPLIVKPSNLGSSIGISKAKNRTELLQAIETADKFDHSIVIEKSIEELQEVNIGVFKTNEEIVTSNLEYPLSVGDILSFRDKYLVNNAKNNDKKNEEKIQASYKKEIESLAKKCYEIFDLDGFVRIDFMIDKNENKIYVNEINTIPGSFSFYLWLNRFKSFKYQIDSMIEEAIKKSKKNLEITYSYKSNALASFSGGQKFYKK